MCRPIRRPGRDGFKTDDLIQSINGQPVRELADLLRLRDAAAGKPLSVGIVRGQQPQTLQVDSYNYCVAETRDDQEFRVLGLASADDRISIKRIRTRPGTHNEPPDSASRRAARRELRAGIRQWRDRRCLQSGSGQGDRVGRNQRLVLRPKRQTGTAALRAVRQRRGDADPGWNVEDRAKFKPIAEVDTRSQKVRRFLATGIRNSDASPLGTFRWLVLVVSPVTEIQENTAYQEIQIR